MRLTNCARLSSWHLVHGRRRRRQRGWSPTLRPAITRVSLRNAEAGKAYEFSGRRFAAVSTVWDGVTSTISGSTETSVSYEHVSHYAARLLLLVALGDDGRVAAGDVASGGPFIYDRTETRTID